MTSTQFVIAWIRTRGRSDRGAALLEYAFLLVLIVVACLTALTFLGDNNKGSAQHSADEIVAAN